MIRLTEKADGPGHVVSGTFARFFDSQRKGVLLVKCVQQLRRGCTIRSRISVEIGDVEKNGTVERAEVC